MAFDWDRYLDVAEHLNAQQPADRDVEQAYIRAAISRAYYAAYWIARRYLQDRHNLYVRGDTHKTVLRELRHHNRSLATQLERLYTQRIDADYKVRVQFARNQSVGTVATARNLIAQIDAL